MIVNKTFSLLFLTLMLAHLAGCNPFGKLGSDLALNPVAVISLSQSVLTVSNTQVAVGEDVSVTLTLKDSSGATILSNNYMITFSHTDGSSIGTFGEVVSNNNGSFTATFTGVSAGTPTIISASVNGQAITSSLPSVLVYQRLSVAPSISIPKSSGYSYTYTPEGGFPPYTFELVSGSGNINSSGVYTAGTTGAGATVRVIDSLGHYQDSTVHFSHLLVRGAVSAQAVDNDGNLYIGGSFTGVRPYSAPGAIALNTTNGNPELSFDLQSGFDGGINVIVKDRLSGAIYVGGAFTTYRGMRANNLVKLNQFGALDSNFNSDGLGFDGEVSSLTLSSDGSKLYVGGSFTSYRGLADSARGIAKLSTTTGEVDEAFHPVSPTGGFQGQVGSLALSSDGSTLYVGGSFTSYRGVTDSARRIAKLSTLNGTLDETFHPASSTGGFDNFVSAIVLSPDESALYVGGFFTQYRNISNSAGYIAKLSTADGAINTTFHQTLGSGGFNGIVRGLALSADGSALYVGGMFTKYKNVTNSAKGIAKLNTENGAIDTTFHPISPAGGFTGYVNALSLSADGTTLFVGGSLGVYRGIEANNIAKFNSDGVLDSTFNGDGSGFDAAVSALALSPNEPNGPALYVGGGFLRYRGVANSARRIAKLSTTNGAINTTFHPAVSTGGFNLSVTSLALSPDGQFLYTGGAFSTYRSVTNSARRIAKLSTLNGDINTTFHPAVSSGGFNAVVSSLALSPDGQYIYAGGDFSTYRGVANPALRIAKLSTSSGTLDTTFHPNSATGGFNGAVYSLALDSDGSTLYVGGEFSIYRQENVLGIAKLLTSNGNRDANFLPGFSGVIYSLALSSDSNLYIGGYFLREEETILQSIGKVSLSNGSLDESFYPSSPLEGFDSNVTSLTLSPDNSLLYVGGDFTKYQSSNVLGWASLDLFDGKLKND